MNHLLRRLSFFFFTLGGLWFQINALVAAPFIIDFERLPATNFIPGGPIPPAARLSDQLISSRGIRFSSGADYVAVVQLGMGHATSGVNGIGGSTPNGILTYNSAFPITATFVSPENPSVPAITDFVRVRGDLTANSGESPTLEAFDLAGNLITSLTLPDISGQTWAISAPGIHSVRFSGVDRPDVIGGGVALDDFAFNPVTAVPEPGIIGLAIGAALSCCFARTKKTDNSLARFVG